MTKNLAARRVLFRAGSVIALLALGFLAPEAAWAQCSMCREAAGSSSTETREALNYAIIGLAFTPYGVAALAAWTISPAFRAWLRAAFARLGAPKTGRPA